MLVWLKVISRSKTDSGASQSAFASGVPIAARAAGLPGARAALARAAACLDQPQALAPAVSNGRRTSALLEGSNLERCGALSPARGHQCEAEEERGATTREQQHGSVETGGGEPGRGEPGGADIHLIRRDQGAGHGQGQPAFGNCYVLLPRCATWNNYV